MYSREPPAYVRRGFVGPIRMTAPVRLGLAGLGTVGGGVIELLRKNRRLIESKVGAPIKMEMVCDRSATAKEIKKLGVRARFTRHAEEVVNDPGVDIFVELIGGYEPARSLVLRALQRGKH